MWPLLVNISRTSHDSTHCSRHILRNSLVTWPQWSSQLLADFNPEAPEDFYSVFPRRRVKKRWHFSCDLPRPQLNRRPNDRNIARESVVDQISHSSSGSHRMMPHAGHGQWLPRDVFRQLHHRRFRKNRVETDIIVRRSTGWTFTRLRWKDHADLCQRGTVDDNLRHIGPIGLASNQQNNRNSANPNGESHSRKNFHGVPAFHFRMRIDKPNSNINTTLELNRKLQSTISPPARLPIALNVRSRVRPVWNHLFVGDHMIIQVDWTLFSSPLREDMAYTTRNRTNYLKKYNLLSEQ